MNAVGANGLFSASDLARLDRLRVHRRRTVPGERYGDWRAGRIGAGGLFADHRDYVPGDDLRYVDWNVYGRLGDLVVKRFEAEENLNLLLCVDRSSSMQGAKSRQARRIAGALGYIALAHLEHVRLAWLPTLGAPPVSVHRGRERARAFLDELTAVADGGETDHALAINHILAATRSRGVALVLSDFYDPHSTVAGLSSLRSHGLDVAALHVVDSADVDLPLGAALRAVDRETGRTIDVDVDEPFLERLRATWRRRAYLMERWCVAREILYHRIDASASLWAELREMLQRGVVTGAR